MDSVLASIKIKQRLSKLASFDSRNLKDWQMEEGVNKAALDYFRRNKHGGNQYKEGDEATIQRVDDFQFLLKSHTLSGSSLGVYLETVTLPTDYLYHKRVTPQVSKGVCKYGIRSTVVEEANVDEYLRDYNSQPSFDFEETFHTLIGNRIRVYHNNDFTVGDVNIIYYRHPVKINFVDKAHNSDAWEWKDDVAEQIIDEAVKILAGDIESFNQQQIAEARVEKNN